MTTLLLPSLQVTQDAVLPALRAALAELDPTSRLVGEYHFGLVERDGTPRPQAGGKGMRPALALLSAQAAGAPVEVGIPGAVAVELVHNFSLLHDDVMDGDLTRRHRPTVWAVWGAPTAILAGDSLLVAALRVLLRSESPHAPAAAQVLADATLDLIRGQFEDLSFEDRATVRVDEVVAMATGKTAALLAASAAVGAVLAGAPAATTAALADFGSELGVAFQLVDDLLGIWGDPGVTGKPVLSDLRARKKTLPVAFALSTDTAAAGELADWLAAPTDDTEESLRRAARLVEAAGGRDWAAAEAQRRFDSARRRLVAADLDPDARRELIDLGTFVLKREF